MLSAGALLGVLPGDSVQAQTPTATPVPPPAPVSYFAEDLPVLTQKQAYQIAQQAVRDYLYEMMKPAHMPRGRF